MKNNIITLITMVSFTFLFSKSSDAQHKWQVSSGGSAEWKSQAVGSGWELGSRHYADFDGDKRDDVFIYKNGQFLISSGADRSWKGLNSSFSGLNFSSLRFGDFNGDGKTDVFFKWKTDYGYVSAGVGKFIRLRKADIPLNRLGFGDFNGDGKTDILWQKS